TLVELLVSYGLLPRERLPQIEINSELSAAVGYATLRAQDSQTRRRYRRARPTGGRGVLAPTPLGRSRPDWCLWLELRWHHDGAAVDRKEHPVCGRHQRCAGHRLAFVRHALHRAVSR